MSPCQGQTLSIMSFFPKKSLSLFWCRQGVLHLISLHDHYSDGPSLKYFLCSTNAKKQRSFLLRLIRCIRKSKTAKVQSI